MIIVHVTDDGCQVGIGGNLTQHAIDYETYRVCQTLLRDVSELPQPSSLA